MNKHKIVGGGNLTRNRRTALGAFISKTRTGRITSGNSSSEIVRWALKHEV